MNLENLESVPEREECRLSVSEEDSLNVPNSEDVVGETTVDLEEEEKKKEEAVILARRRYGPLCLSVDEHRQRRKCVNSLAAPRERECADDDGGISKNRKETK